MDTSEQYIKMCNCPEIQENRPADGDRLAHYINDEAFVDVLGNYWGSNKYPCETWLPRQDQIQDMVRKHKAQEMDSKRPHDEWFPKGDIGLGYVFNGFIKFASDYLREIYNSFEQLWLAFYMYEKHGGIWDGKKWVKK